MDRSSYFVKNKALFGSYPTQEQVIQLESLGVRYFIDLTYLGEKRIIPYKTQYEYMKYSIPDRRVPTDWKSFAQFIINVGHIIKNLPPEQRIYVHCKGGHGRSGVVVACLLCYMYNISPSDALSKTSKYHSRRKEMREKWRKMGSPQTRSQKHFVTKFFEPLIIYKNYTTYFSSGFNNDAEFSVIIPGLGLFPTATSAFYAFKDPNNTDIPEIHRIGTNEKIIMYNVLKYKFNQHETIRKNLTTTGLRPIIVRSVDPYWGMLENSGKNTLGKLLIKLRKNLYKSSTIFT